VNVLILASETHGGAGLSAARLHQSLLNANQNSVFTFGAGCTHLASSQKFQPSVNALGRYADRLLDQFFWNARKPGASLFTRTRRMARGGMSPILKGVQIVHLHWIAKWLDWPSLFAAIPLEVPIVLTLHDSSFFAGGCHQTNGCVKYENRCTRCPMLKRDVFDLAARGFRIREKCFEGRKIYPVPNSRWMAVHASKAALFKPFPLEEPIFPGIDSSAFEPMDQPTCRRILGIPEDKFVVCAGSADLSDGNKGMRLLLEALAGLPQSMRSEIALLVYGAGALPGEVAGVPVFQTGLISSERLLSVVYSAADLYVTPSQMETFGMTAAEAGACGLPVVCFATGGLPEIVVDGVTGWLVDLKEGAAGLTAALQNAFEHRADLPAMGEKGRGRVVEDFDIRKSTEQYIALYERISPGGTAFVTGHE
jgi:glycosyltransferase involved in cell wall biosynthesis